MQRHPLLFAQATLGTVFMNDLFNLRKWVTYGKDQQIATKVFSHVSTEPLPIHDDTLRPLPVDANSSTIKALRPPARKSRLRIRHMLLTISFLVCVIVPGLVAFGYLFFVAKDQYASTLGFSVRSEDFSSPLELLGGGLGQLSSSASADSDILYEYIQSQELVETVDARIDLRSIYSKADRDFIFGFDPNGAIEDLVEYWNWMVNISYDGSTQILEIKAKAFAPDDARKIAQEIRSASHDLINRLNLVARQDATRYAKEELDKALQRLKEARAALTQFRTSTQIIDPNVNLEGQMGLLGQLEQQLADALIESDLLADSTRASDPRMTQARRRIEVIQERIVSERTRLAGANGQGEGTLSTLVGEFERLTVEREFAEQAYLAALSAHDTAIAEAQRQSRYLAAHIEPTLAQSAQYPKRELIMLMAVGILFMAWVVLVLIYYSIRDRR